MAASYKRMLELLNKWPIDKNKKGKDLGEYIRYQVQEAFTAGKFNSNPEECDKKYLSLKRIADDHYLKQYQRHSTSSATGLTAEECNQILSPEFLEALEKEDRGIFRSIFSFKQK